ncbi:MAG TPA: choice-of-anchor Q domain-containing protein [Terriglobales bacterium]
MKFKRSIWIMTLALAGAMPALAGNTWYVDGVKGSDSNNCQAAATACKTIGHAISLALSGDSVVAAAAAYNENLTIGVNLNLSGAGAPTTIIDGGYANRVIGIPYGVTVALSGLTIQHGSAVESGAGIWNEGTVTLSQDIVRENLATFSSAEGGGIYNGGTMTINASNVGGNHAYGDHEGQGGGIFNVGTLAINNSTINGNSAHGAEGAAWGGGIFNSGVLTISSSTLSGNFASRVGGFFNDNGAATLQNTIIANSSFAGNCEGTITSHGYNLSSDASCNLQEAGDWNDVPVLLGLLHDNGGPTWTMAPLPGSAAIDGGNPAGCTDGEGNLLTTDQRGLPRPGKYKHDHRCDIGAFEHQSD